MRIRTVSDRHGLHGGHEGVRTQLVGRLRSSGELKVVSIDPGAATELHEHAHTHLVLVVAGAGFVATAQRQRSIGPDSIVAVEAHEPHSFGAEPDGALRFVCLDEPAG